MRNLCRVFSIVVICMQITACGSGNSSPEKSSASSSAAVSSVAISSAAQSSVVSSSATSSSQASVSALGAKRLLPGALPTPPTSLPADQLPPQ
jgi:hypothetical protein